MLRDKNSKFSANPFKLKIQYQYRDFCRMPKHDKL